MNNIQIRSNTYDYLSFKINDSYTHTFADVFYMLDHKKDHFILIVIEIHPRIKHFTL